MMGWRRPLVTGLAPVMAGSLHALALSPWVAAIGGSWPAALQSLALVGLLWCLSGARRARDGALSAWLYGSTWLVGATGWMFVSLHHFGGLPAWLAALAVGLLCMALSGYMALVGVAWVRWRRGRPLADAALFGALWLLAELARALLFTGFPWGASGYALIDSPFERLAPWLGVYGLGATWATLVAWAALGVGRRAPLACLPLLAVVGGLAAWPAPEFTRPHGSPLRVELLQSNVPQDEKFDAARLADMLNWHAVQLAQARGDLIVAPETAIPLLPEQLPPGYWDAVVASFGSSSGRAALIGVPLGSFESGYSNSVVGLAGQGAAYRYDKHHLVPFGEFIPAGFRWFVSLMNMPLGDFSRGPLAAPSFAVKGQRVAPNICYEDLFGEEIATRFVDARRAPTLLANVSNLAWFGDTVAIFQHLQIARMRSLEFQVPTIRSTNTGATVVIDHLGVVTHRMPTQTRGVLRADVQGRAGQTPFAQWAGRLGLWPLVLLGLAVAALCVRRGVSAHGLGASAIH
ncbi:MAG: apolipoprotein N-acyltransferase [Burkholderiales bacterium]|nr:apolipoprotein N-acyltransferase [Burkholderiales bacterium]MBH2017382.1 apolipoprotein N-acyltransferase [Burkholderiales bacterium]